MMKWLWDDEAGLWYSEDGKWDILPCGESEPAFMLRNNIGDDNAAYWEAVDTPYPTVERAQAAAVEHADYAAGLFTGETWARATGTTEADLHMVPAVTGSHAFRLGYRLGVAKIRRERHLKVNNTPDDSGKPLFECRYPQCQRKA